MDDLEIGAIRNDFHRPEIVLKPGEKSVARDNALDQGQVKVGAEWERLRVNLRSPANEDLGLKLIGVQLFQGAENPYFCWRSVEFDEF